MGGGIAKIIDMWLWYDAKIKLFCFGIEVVSVPAKLQNTPQLICISFDKNNLFCIPTCTSEMPPRGNDSGEMLRGILQLHLHLPVEAKLHPSILMCLCMHIFFSKRVVEWRIDVCFTSQ